MSKLQNLFKQHKIRTIALGFVVIVGILATVQQLAVRQDLRQNASSGVSVEVRTSAKELQVGKPTEFLVDILNGTSKKINSFDITLSYDPKYLEYSGSHMMPPFQSLIVTPMQEAGKIRIAGVIEDNKTLSEAPYGIGGTVASITFITKGITPESRIEFANADVAALDDEKNVASGFLGTKFSIVNEVATTTPPYGTPMPTPPEGTPTALKAGFIMQDQVGKKCKVGFDPSGPHNQCHVFECEALSSTFTKQPLVGSCTLDGLVYTVFENETSGSSTPTPFPTLQPTIGPASVMLKTSVGYFYADYMYVSLDGQGVKIPTVSVGNTKASDSLVAIQGQWDNENGKYSISFYYYKNGSSWSLDKVSIQKIALATGAISNYDLTPIGNSGLTTFKGLIGQEAQVSFAQWQEIPGTAKASVGLGNTRTQPFFTTTTTPTPTCTPAGFYGCKETSTGKKVCIDPPPGVTICPTSPTPAPTVILSPTPPPPCSDGILSWRLEKACTPTSSSFASGSYTCTDGSSGSVSGSACLPAANLYKLAQTKCAKSPKACPTPTPSCIPQTLNTISYDGACRSLSFRPPFFLSGNNVAVFTCSDGYKGKVGNPKACNNASSLKDLASKECSNRCSYPKPTVIPGDLSLDGSVNKTDYNILVACIKNKKKCEARQSTDLNGDGKTNDLDLVILNRLIQGFSTN